MDKWSVLFIVMLFVGLTALRGGQKNTQSDHPKPIQPVRLEEIGVPLPPEAAKYSKGPVMHMPVQELAARFGKEEAEKAMQREEEARYAKQVAEAQRESLKEQGKKASELIKNINSKKDLRIKTE